MSCGKFAMYMPKSARDREGATVRLFTSQRYESGVETYRTRCQPAGAILKTANGADPANGAIAWFERGERKLEILEVEQRQQVQRHAGGQQREAARAFGAFDQQAEHKARADHKQQDQDQGARAGEDEGQ